MAFQKGHTPWDKGLKRWTKKYKNAGFQKGHPNYLKGHSEKTRKKISEGRKGKDNPAWNGGKEKYICKVCGKEFYAYSIAKRLYCSQKCANICLDRKKQLIKSHIGKYGEVASNWQGGKISSENELLRGRIEFRLWREAVFARDNWTCQKCKIKGGKIHPHHIQNFAQFPELRFAIDNGITFCQKCHRDFHRRYGIKNNNLNQIKEFLKT